MRKTIVIAVLLLSACKPSVEKGSPFVTGPAGISNINDGIVWSISSLEYTGWTGTTTPTGLGEAGVLDPVNITNGDGGSVSIQFTWTSGVTSQSYNGTVSGTYNNLTIQATNAPNSCNYTAQGSLSDDSLVFSGTYSGTGSSHCLLKSGTFRLTRECTNCEPEPVCVGPWVYNGSNPFNLQPSSDANELSYVLANVTPNQLSGPNKTNLSATSWASDGNYPVVLLKGPQSQYILIVNVTTGQVIQSPFENNNGRQQDFSHASTFICTEQDN
jgi:hypothetical protein